MNASAMLVLVRGTILRITDLRSRHAYMRVAVATATTPPRQATPTRPARHRAGNPELGSRALAVHHRLPAARVKAACGVAQRALRAP